MKTKELNRIKVNVNGLEMEVFSNLTILQALIQEDIYIPHLCYDMRLDRSNGNCGLCVVELGEGSDKRDVKACQTPIKEGMVICTNSPRLSITGKFGWNRYCRIIMRIVWLPV